MPGRRMNRYLHAIAAAVVAIPALAHGDNVLQGARALIEAPATAATETALHSLVLDVATRPPDAATRALVEELAGREPQVFVAHDEGPALVPLVDVGAAARSVLRDWQRADARERVLGDWRRRGAMSLDAYFLADPIGRDGFLDAVARADIAQLVVMRDEVLARVGEPGGDRLAVVVGRRLSDRELLVRVIEGGTGVVAQRLVRDARDFSDAALRHVVLRRALARGDVASLALFALAASGDDKSDALVWDKLADPVLGATAAAILAREGGAATIARLTAMLDGDLPLLTRQRAALALALSQDAEAQRTAREWRAGQ